MKTNITAIHFDLEKEMKEYIEKMISRIQYAEDLIIDFDCILRKENRRYISEIKIHYRWGAIMVIRVKSYNLAKGLNRLFDKMERRVRKAKEQIKHHNHDLYHRRPAEHRSE